MRYRTGNFLIAHRSDSEPAAEVPQAKVWGWHGCTSREKSNWHCGRFIFQPKNDTNLPSRCRTYGFMHMRYRMRYRSFRAAAVPVPSRCRAYGFSALHAQFHQNLSPEFYANENGKSCKKLQAKRAKVATKVAALATPNFNRICTILVQSTLNSTFYRFLLHNGWCISLKINTKLMKKQTYCH